MHKSYAQTGHAASALMRAGAAIVLLLSPAARRLAPSWLYYDLVGRRMGGLPAAAEQYLLAEGQAFCSVGRDTACRGV